MVLLIKVAHHTQLDSRCWPLTVSGMESANKVVSIWRVDPAIGTGSTLTPSHHKIRQADRQTFKE